MCAEPSKDPREYLPFLQELQKLEKYYQRYRIDDHLKRYEKALRNLSRCGNSFNFSLRKKILRETFNNFNSGDEHFEELLQYMQQHSLYLTALDEYAKKPQQKRVILEIYGDHLSERNAYEEAGIGKILRRIMYRWLDANISKPMKWRTNWIRH